MKKKLHYIFLVTIITLFFSGCGKEPTPYDYSAFLESKPRSILVLLPTNQTVEPKASAAVLAHATLPLCEAGYYVFPSALVNDTFKNNGVYEPNEIKNIPLQKLRNIFHADAVLYLNVSEYGTNYMIIDTVTKVAVSATLIDLRSGKKLWENKAIASNDSGGSGGGIVGMLVSAAIEQVAKTLADASYDVARRADNALFSTKCNGCILAGPYSPLYQKDLSTK